MTPVRRRNTLCIVITLALGGGVSAILPAQTPAPRRNIDSLLARMTLEEKFGQLNLPSVDNRPSAEQLELLRKGLVGGFLNLTGAAATRETQRVAVTESRLGIPLLLGYDVIHGYRTTFPIPLAEASTWDPAAVEATAHAAAREAAAAGVNWTFAPMVDVARDPRWGRISEGAGEDPYLGSVLAAARVHGFQGADLRAPDAVMATAKHFAAYGGAEGGRDYNTVDVSERTLREIYLPPFRAAVDAGAGSIMTSFNEIAGTPSHANRWLVTALLRGEWKFSGLVVSDWTGVEELRAHGVAGSRADAGKLALETGVDMDMVSRIYVDDLPALVRAGRIPVATVDAAVRRVLAAKAALGLFDDPYHGATVEREQAVLLAPEHRKLAREVAREAIVLLRNEAALLPLTSARHTVAVIGPLADDKSAALDSWPGHGDPRDAITLLEGIRVQAWQLGVETGHALADVLFGDVSPSGKLPVTVPRSVGQVPIYYNHKNTGRPPSAEKYTSKYIDLPVSPLFPFGYGLSYTSFEYKDLKLSAPSITPSGKLRVSVTVTNTGAREGAEVAQLYLHDEVASVTRPVRALAGFQRVPLKAGESRTVDFEVGAKQLGLYDQNMKFTVEPGRVRVFVGGSSVGGLEAEFEVRR